MIELRSVDCHSLHAAFVEAFADYAMGSPTGLTEERLLLRMKKNAVDYNLSVAAYDQGRMVGFTLLGVDTWGGRLTAFDAGTGIVPSCRGQGLARRMFDYSLPALRERRVEQFALEVLQKNEPAIRTYRKAGFEPSRDLRSFSAARGAVVVRPVPRWRLRPIDVAMFEEVASESDWLPSFENRVSAVRAIADAVALWGAFDGDYCIGAVAYSPPLRWLLSLVVRRSHRRCGAGQMLLGHAAASMPDDVDRITALNVDSADVGMQAFFAKMGFSFLVDQYEMTRSV